MRTSVLSRSVIAVATLAIGSVALAAVPATAATPSGITRDQVLSLAAAARAEAASDVLSPAAADTAFDILQRECGLTAGQSVSEEFGILLEAVAPSSAVDGFYLEGTIESSGAPVRECVVGAVAPLAPGFALSGTSTLSVSTGIPALDPAPKQSTLSGDVTVSTIPDVNGYSPVSEFSYSTTGATSKTTTTQTSTQVQVPKTAAQKKAAKKTYDKRLKAAKKAYQKALKKAGSSKSKKSKAKKTYAAKKASAKKAYRSAIAAGSRTVTSSTTVNDVRPFSTQVTSS